LSHPQADFASVHLQYAMLPRPRRARRSGKPPGIRPPAVEGSACNGNACYIKSTDQGAPQRLETRTMAGWFANQVAVITGASSGIGWELARVLAAEGAKVGLVARRPDKLAALAEVIRLAGGTAACAAADVGDRQQCVAALRELAQTLGPVDLFVANAGVGTGTTLDPVNTADVEAILRINVLGLVYATEALLPEMLRRGKGHIAGVSSLASYKGLPGQPAYSASKAALNTYLEALRIQLRPRGIAVTTICPGFIRTPMTAGHRFRMPFLMDADVAARRIARALHRRRKVYSFPLPMALLMRLTWLMPDWLMSLVANRYVESVSYEPIGPPQPPEKTAP